MNKKLLCGVMSLTLGMLLLSGCSSNSGADGDTIKIGGLGPLTGAASSYGQSVKNGALLLEKEIQKDLEDVFLKFPRLKERKKQLAGTLSGGEQQMLAIGRALMNRPDMLILDEPSMGLAPIIVKEIFNIIVDINKSGTTILLVEQNANMALSIANRAYVLENGHIILSGNAKEISTNEAVKNAYLGD